LSLDERNGEDLRLILMRTCPDEDKGNNVDEGNNDGEVRRDLEVVGILTDMRAVAHVCTLFATV